MQKKMEKMLNLNFDKYFYQGYLYQDLPIENGEILYELQYIHDIGDCFELYTPPTIFDINVEIKHYLSLDYLMALDDKDKWESLFREVNNIDVLIIIDDVKLNNLELYVYKELFLKVYSYNFNEHCKKVFIYSK